MQTKAEAVSGVVPELAAAGVPQFCAVTKTTLNKEKSARTRHSPLTERGVLLEALAFRLMNTDRTQVRFCQVDNKLTSVWYAAGAGRACKEDTDGPSELQQGSGLPTRGTHGCNNEKHHHLTPLHGVHGADGQIARQKGSDRIEGKSWREGRLLRVRACSPR